MGSFKSEILISTGLIILSLALLDPFMVIMPGSLAMMVIVVLAALFIVFAAFIWRERAHDEREERIRMSSGRLAWLTGAAILTIGVVSEGLVRHRVDSWLIIALIGMIITKIIARWYAQRNH